LYFEDVLHIAEKPLLQDFLLAGKGQDFLYESMNGQIVLDELGIWFV
jgi:hypothetical protein